MSFFKLALIASLAISSIYAYVDNDIDGVDDSVDLCLNTPLDVIVDSDGCGEDEKGESALTLKIGSDVRFNTLSDSVRTINFFANYSFKDWDVSLSNSHYTTNNDIPEISNASGDFYLTSGYLFQSDQFYTKFSMGMKFATADESVGTGEIDYLASINLSYFLNDRQDLSFYYGYTKSGDSATVNYQDFSSLSLGSGLSLTEKWYSSISYDYSGSNSEDIDAYQALSWFNRYALTKKFFVVFNYTYGLDELSYDHTLSCEVGAHFE